MRIKSDTVWSFMEETGAFNYKWQKGHIFKNAFNAHNVLLFLNVFLQSKFKLILLKKEKVFANRRRCKNDADVTLSF